MLFLCLALWILLCGKFTLEILAFGVIIYFLIFIFSRKYLGHTLRIELGMIRNCWNFIRFTSLLVWEIIKANIQVIKIVLSPKIEIDPEIIYFKPKLKTSFCRAVLANAITLTPGTITVDVANDLYCVHAIDAGLCEGIDDSIFARKLRIWESAELQKEKFHG